MINGATLNTSGQTLTVLGDYTNTASGIGNAYNPFAGITGTIDGHGTQMAIVGVDGTVVNSSGGTLSISIAPGGTADFVIENTGAAGSAILRGALQTSVNGGQHHQFRAERHRCHRAGFRRHRRRQRERHLRHRL